MRRIIAGWVALAGLLAGCSDETDTATSTAASSSSGAGGGAGTVTVNGLVFDAQTDKPVADVMVCVAEHPEVTCATSFAADGSFALEGVPADAQVHITYDKSGYLPLRWAYDTSFAETGWLAPIVSDETAEAWATAAGASLEPGDGVLAAKASDAQFGIAGATFDSGAGSGPTYVGTEPDPSLTATADDSGLALFFEVTPGSYDVAYTAPEGQSCSIRWGWQGSKAGTLEAVVVAGAMTIVEIGCE